MAGTIVGNIVSGSDNTSAIVAVIDGGSGYTSLADAIVNIGSNNTIYLIGSDTLTKAIASSKTLVVKSGAILTVDLTQSAVLGSRGTISVETAAS